MTPGFRTIPYAIIFALLFGAAMFAQTLPQTDQSILGTWSLQRYDVESTKTLSRRTERLYLHERRISDSLNVLLRSADLDLHVDFRPDSSYSLKRRFQRHVEYFERGTWTLASTIHMHSITHDDVSLFDGARVQWQSADSIVLIFRVGKANDGLWLQVSMKRSEALNEQ